MIFSLYLLGKLSSVSFSCDPKVICTLVFEPAVEFPLKPLDGDSFKREIDNDVNHTRYENAPSVPVVASSVMNKGDQHKHAVHGFHQVRSAIGHTFFV